MPTWMKFRVIERPYYDAKGNVLSSIEGRSNIRGVDEFTGGGKVCPDLSKFTVLERYIEGDTLLVLVEGDATALEKQGPVIFQASPTTQKTDTEGFKSQKLSDAEAKALKNSLFGIKEKVESGVTK